MENETMTDEMNEDSVESEGAVEDSIDYTKDSESKIEQDVKRKPPINIINTVLNHIGPEPGVKFWFTFLPYYMSAFFLTFTFLLQYSLNNIGIAQSFIIFFEITIPILFVIYSIMLVVIGLMKIKINSKYKFYSASMFLSLTFTVSLFCLFMNRGYIDGNFIPTNYCLLYYFSLIVSTIDVFYIFNRVREIVILMIGEYAKETLGD